MTKYIVYLSPVAELKLDLLLDYLENEWGKQTRNRFLKELKSSVTKIENFPMSSIKIELFGGIYKSVVTKQTSFYYRIKEREIEILTITDNRQHPEKTLSEIKNALMD